MGIVLFIFLGVILIVYLYDFTQIRKQNEIMIEQNEKIISLLEGFKKK